MYVTPEQIQSTSKASVEALLSLASTQFSALEKLVALNSTVLKGAFEDTIANARALAGAKDPRNSSAYKRASRSPRSTRPSPTPRACTKVAAQTNAEFSKVAEKRVAELNDSFVSLLDQAVKNAPAGSDVAVNAVKQMIVAANSAYDNLTRAAKQATDIAQANVVAATESAKNFAKAKKVA
jgi:phasin family protein